MRRRNPPTYDAAAQLELFGRNFLAFCTAQKLAGGYLAVRAIASAVYRHKVGRSLPHIIRNASFNEFEVIEVGFGSIASLWPRPDYFRSSPVNGRSQGQRACLKGANKRLVYCSNEPALSSR